MKSRAIQFTGILSTIALSLVVVAPAIARPLIASGEKPLDTDLTGCLSRADQILKRLNVESSDSGPTHRSGYYNDGAFRIVCYETGSNTSLAVMFVAHDSSQETADNFLSILLDDL